MTERRPLQLLVVEDCATDERLLLRELKRGGYDVTHERVETAGELSSALDRQAWDIVISDYMLPQFGAPEALALVRGRGLDVPFIIVSGTVGEETAVAAMRGGANDYVLKDGLTRLCPTIERELREAALRAEQKRMREQLMISDRMASVGVLAAGVAHELNNPLAALVANLELMSSDIARLTNPSEPEDGFGAVVEQLQDAQECAERLRLIVRDLKMFSRVADDEARGPVNVERVLESSLRMARNEIRHRAQLVKEYGKIPAVYANEARLGQVFLNLIINAAQAIREGNAEQNRILIRTHFAAPQQIVVEISDTGDGIPPDHRERIFDAFFTTKPSGIGTGLGLSICHRIITDLGGLIQVESTVGEGTTFRVLLPAAGEDAESAKWIVRELAASRRGRILVVDDEPTIQRAIRRALEREHEVVTLSNAQDALARLRGGEHFDVILCDLMMPQMTGMDLYVELAREHPDRARRIIFVTGGAFTAEARAFLDAVPNASVDKPFKIRELRALVNGRLDDGNPASAPP